MNCGRHHPAQVQPTLTLRGCITHHWERWRPTEGLTEGPTEGPGGHGMDPQAS